MLLEPLHRRLGVLFRKENNVIVPAHYGDPIREVMTLRKEAIFVDRSARGRIRLIGSDARTFLQALFTNDVLQVSSGRGVYGTFLTPKGRMVADARAYLLAKGVWLDTEPLVRRTMLAYLDKYHFSEKVEFFDQTDTTIELSVFGSRAPLIFEIFFPSQRLGVNLTQTEGAWEGKSILAISNSLTGEAGFDIIAPGEVGEALAECILSLGVKPAGWDAVEIARREAGVPRFGVELTEQTIPLEAGLQKNAISFNKGCYVGQEIIARIDARGEPAKRLVGFSIEDGLVPDHTPIKKGEREVGELIWTMESPSLKGRRIGMGYVHKDIADIDTELVAGGRKVWIVPLPFYPPYH